MNKVAKYLIMELKETIEYITDESYYLFEHLIMLLDSY